MISFASFTCCRFFHPSARRDTTLDWAEEDQVALELLKALSSRPIRPGSRGAGGFEGLAASQVVGVVWVKELQGGLLGIGVVWWLFYVVFCCFEVKRPPNNTLLSFVPLVSVSFLHIKLNPNKGNTKGTTWWVQSFQRFAEWKWIPPQNLSDLLVPPRIFQFIAWMDSNGVWLSSLGLKRDNVVFGFFFPRSRT